MWNILIYEYNKTLVHTYRPLPNSHSQPQCTDLWIQDILLDLREYKILQWAAFHNVCAVTVRLPEINAPLAHSAIHTFKYILLLTEDICHDNALQKSLAP